MTTNSYFTFADKLTQDRMGDRTIADKRKRIERNLKASLLINEGVIFRAYSAIESDITESILSDNKVLIDNGIIIPEYRMGSEVLSKEIDKHLSKNTSRKNYMRKMATAEMLDSIKSKREVDAEKLSQSRSFCLALLLYRLALNPNEHFKAATTTNDLMPVFEKLFNKGIPPRNFYLDDIKRLFKKQNDAINLVQSVYFGVGAHYTQANPVWTNEINPHKHENLKIWLSKQPDLKVISKENLLVAQKFGITDFLEENKNDIEYLNDVLTVNQISERIVSNLRITDSDLDDLAFTDILELRKTKQFENFSEYVSKNISDRDYGVERMNLEKQKRTFEKREKAVEVTCTVLGFIPLVGIFFHLLPATMKLLFNKKSKDGLSQNLPLYSYSETITEKVLSKHENQ